ncbi:MAG: SO_0444 family Cu/Zn efflux transporter [Candidatus Omnitrophota bacterium]
MSGVYEIVSGIVRESYFLLNRMSPYLLFGFLFAGILHVFIDTAFVARHLGKDSFPAVIKASLFGIPLPLCSCGVLPAAAGLRRQGAGKGAVLSFLISTPTTGIDSIFATYSFLGGFFTFYRVLASFFAGVLSGTLANIFLKGGDNPLVNDDKTVCRVCFRDNGDGHAHTLAEKAREALRYAFVVLLGDTGKSIIGGIALGGVISYSIPEGFIHRYMAGGWQAMLIMLVIGIPMYVCSTASIPIAVALMLKGMNPGAAFVFLLAGPATNAVGMAVVAKLLGKKALVIYLLSISFSAVALGLLLDRLWPLFQSGSIKSIMHSMAVFPVWFDFVSSFLLLALIVFNILRK